MRFFYKKNIDNYFKLFVWMIDEKIDWLEKNTFFESQEYKKIKNLKRKKEWLGSRYLLQTISNYKKISYSKSGKPLIKKGNISISHSEGLVGICISKKNVSIDIQKIKEKINLIENKFINDFELSQVKKQNPKIINTIIWTIKEAVCKYLDNKKINFKNEILIEEINTKQKFAFVYTKKRILKVNFELQKNYIITYII